MSPPDRPHTPIEKRKAERELFFWTAFQALKLILTVALVLYTVISLIEGKLPGGDSLLRSLGGS
ncbi:MAG TPA: hypothetical protein VES97_06525 [Solirubrobacteraceae bacterium]|nr:hypothetical protein [Solirubrobacteraceae bacterium]